ncbi:MAG: FAD-dependent oxidoreductase [Planctomycetota bacterium]|jgi:NADPH-dependent 2,4-dienoyl-CoA reductase/sulfur reductase-like enzyme/peroxiredoxin family protein/rhodanese-related sulfurtransferase/TusA-related sulfurtransferase
MAERKRIVIVGGVAGGASAAARARRLSEDAEIVIFERGEHISFANCGLPYHIGGTIEKRKRLLVSTPDEMRDRFRVDVRTRSEVLRVDREARQVVVRNLQSGQETSESYDALILSPGAEPLKPPIPGADGPDVFTLRSLHDMDAIMEAVQRADPAHAVVVGGGYIGLEMAEALRHRKLGVTLVELAKQVFVAADPEMVAPVHQQLKLHGVDLRLGTSITAVRRENDRLIVILSTGESVQSGLVIMAVGIRPEARLAAEAGLEIGSTGGIVVDDHMRTSDPHVYAVGDAVEVTHFVGRHKALVPLAGPANRQGRIAADNALGRQSTYAGSQGTAICKVFDLAIGMTGLSEKALKQAGSAYEKVYVHPASHAGYYPGAVPISLKLLFHPADGKVLGAQAVGADGVDKRIDVLAVALRAGLTVYDLAEQELAYAPPYGSAKDPVNYAGFVAANVLNGDVRLCHVDDVVSPGHDQMLLDVRTPKEVQGGTIPGSTNIPIDRLRERLDELPRDKEILAFCQVGLRGYLASRILSQRGFNCRNLTGGYKTYRAAMGVLNDKDNPKRTTTDDTGQHAPAAEKADVRQFQVVGQIDARSMQCPGPIMELQSGLDEAEDGDAVTIVADDPGFPSDVAAWCESTGNRLLEIAPKNGACEATVMKQTGPAPAACAEGHSKNKTIVVFSGDLDKALAAFVIANGAAAMNSKVTMFFTFWGLNVLRRPEKVKVKKGFMERMFGWMMPRGAGRLKLSKMNMGGMGAAMIKGIMQKKNVASLPEMIETARQAGVRLVACSMSMNLMGIRREELVDGVEEGGVAMYLNEAEAGGVNLFI